MGGFLPMSGEPPSLAPPDVYLRNLGCGDPVCWCGLALGEVVVPFDKGGLCMEGVSSVGLLDARVV
jgi:hypothetical protein